MKRAALIVAVLALLTVLALPSHQAQARELTPTERAEIQDVASRAWPGSRCTGRVQLIWSHEIVAPPMDTATRALVAQGYELYGYATGTLNGTCDALVRGDLDAPVACTVAAHEAGHLAGLEHNDGLPVMGDQVGAISEGYVWPACWFLVTLRLADAADWMWQRVSSDTRVACKRRSASQVQCVTSRPRAHRSPVRKVFRVWSTGPGVVRGARLGRREAAT